MKTVNAVLVSATDLMLLVVNKKVFVKIIQAIQIY